MIIDKWAMCIAPPPSCCLLPAFFKIRNLKSEIRNLKIDSDAIKLHNAIIMGRGLLTHKVSKPAYFMNCPAHRKNTSKETAL